MLRLEFCQGRAEIATCLVAIFGLLQGLAKGVLQVGAHRLLGHRGRLVVMVAALVVTEQAVVAGRHPAGEAVVLQILAHMLPAAHRLVYDQLVVDVLLQVLDPNDLMVLEATHVLVRIVAAAA